MPSTGHQSVVLLLLPHWRGQIGTSNVTEPGNGLFPGNVAHPPYRGPNASRPTIDQVELFRRVPTCPSTRTPCPLIQRRASLDSVDEQQ